MKQSKRLISERRVRTAIFAAYDEYNPDNKPREISAEVIDSLDEILWVLIEDVVEQEVCINGRLNLNGFFETSYYQENI